MKWWQWFLVMVWFVVRVTAIANAAAVSPPNIILILADDLGYGDVKCNNPEGKIATPNLDRLAEHGMRFTDAHAPSAVCSPTRYAILTGRYAWRSRLKAGVLWQWDSPLIEAGRPTLASLLHGHGYHTGAIGKWHLGMNWPYASAESANKLSRQANQDKALCADIDWSKPITGGPIDQGFDDYFGVNAPNFSPYVFIENNRIVGEAPTMQWQGMKLRMSQHAGPAQAGFDRKNIAPTMAKRAVSWIEQRGKQKDQPFFLYFALTGPHSPIIPNDAFKGRSGIGDYGDFVMEMDWTVGEVVAALQRAGLSENTLVIFTSDNGPESWNYQEAHDQHHYAMGPLRGVKRDNWEGGHRVPFIASWPAHIKPGVVSDETICHVDLMATATALAGVKVPNGAGEDSYDLTSILLGVKHDKPIREATVHHAGNGKLAIRQGHWVLIDAKTGDGNKEPEWFKKERGYQPHSFPGELYDLDQDLPERRNLYGEHPEVVARLKSLLEKYRVDGRSASRPAEK